MEDSAAQQEALHDTLLAERAADLRDLGRRVLARLCGVEAPREPEQPYILVMDEVGPSDVARLDAQRVAGILTARGGATSHSAIIARALGIPALVGAGAAVLGLEPGTALLLDGEHGWLQVAPSTGPRRRAASGACADPRRPRGGSLRQPWRHRRRRARGGAGRRGRWPAAHRVRLHEQRPRAGPGDPGSGIPSGARRPRRTSAGGADPGCRRGQAAAVLADFPRRESLSGPARYPLDPAATADPRDPVARAVPRRRGATAAGDVSDHG